VDKGTGDAKQARWYYDHEDGVCKVSELIFYLFIFFLIIPGRRSTFGQKFLFPPKIFVKKLIENILGAIVDEDFSQNLITRQDTTNQVEKFYNSVTFSQNFY
jgi:hypothetical protein